MAKRKMRFDKNGVLIPEGAVDSPEKHAKSDPLNLTAQQVPVISSVDEMDAAAELNIATAVSTQAILQEVNGDAYAADLKVHPEFDVMQAIGEQNEIDRTPIGLTNKLMTAAGVDRHYVIDNSGSMGSALRLRDKEGNINPTALLKNAHPEILKRRRPSLETENTETMTRYEEAESRLHYIIDKLKYIPTGDWSFDFMNDGRVNGRYQSLDCKIERGNKSPDQFALEAHRLVSEKFSVEPTGTTPLNSTVMKAFEDIKRNKRAKLSRDSEIETKVHFTIITDGDPTPNASLRQTPKQANEEIVATLKNRETPEEIPTHVWLCGEEVKWTELLDKDCPFVVVIDDFQSESIQVREKQGIRFPYTLGFYIVCATVGADPVNKHDLDTVDDNFPYSKFIFDSINGYVPPNNETYLDYLEHNISYFVLKDKIPDLQAQLLNRPESQLAIIEDFMRNWAAKHPHEEASLDHFLVREAGYDSEDYTPPESTLRAFNNHVQAFARSAPERAADSNVVNKAPGDHGVFGRFGALASALPNLTTNQSATTSTSGYTSRF